MKKEIVPVVVYQKHNNYERGVYQYQVFLGEYDRANHVIKNVGKEYECFESNEEVEAYIKGLHTAGAIYGATQ